MAIRNCSTERFRSGDVADHLPEAEKIAAGITQRGEDHIRPEPRSVLAQPPAFVFEVAVSRCCQDFVLRLAERHVFDGEEAREILADDLLALEALKPLRARIPGGHAAYVIEHEYRKVPETVDLQPEVVFAFLRLFELGYAEILFLDSHVIQFPAPEARNEVKPD